MKVVVVLPTYNEAENLPKLIPTLFSLPLDLRVLVVDDNSPDGTGRKADELVKSHPRKMRVLHRPGKGGLRSACLNGFQDALEQGAEVIVQMDADFSHDPSVLIEMVKCIESYDMVLGSRYTAGGSVDEHWPLWRKWLSAFGNFYARTILNIPLRDMTTGYRIWRRETLQQMPLQRIQSNGYLFQVELAYLAHCLEFKVKEYPIYFPDRKWGKSKMSLKIQIEAAVRVWQVLFSYRDIKLKGRNARI